MQPLTDADYAKLKQLPELEDIRLHYVGHTKEHPELEGQTTADSAKVIDAFPNLRILELKHSFGLNKETAPQLGPQPDLVKLELDIPYSRTPSVPLMQSATKVRNFQLHRTSLTKDEFISVIRNMPELEVVEVRPAWPANLQSDSLVAFKDHPKLKAIAMSLDWGELQWEDGLEHLASCPNLEVVQIGVKGIGIDSPAIQKLHEVRPDITIMAGGKKLEGTGEWKTFPRDAGYEWNEPMKEGDW